MRKIIALLLLFFVVSSCNTNEVYNKNVKDFPANRWLKNSQHAFVFDIEDNFEVDSVTVVYLIGRNDFGINFGFDTVFAVKNGDDYIASVPFSKYDTEASSKYNNGASFNVGASFNLD